MKDQPILRHPYCSDDRCSVCLDDLIALKAYLDSATGRDEIDHLAKYHRWLSDNGIANETEHGWPHPDAFSMENINLYAYRYTGKQEAE